MGKSSGNRAFTWFLRIFIPLILFIAGIFVFTSLTLTNHVNNDKLSVMDTRVVHGSEEKLTFTSENKKVNSSNMENFWKKVDLQAIAIPSAVLDKANEVQIKSSRTTIMNVDTFYREANPPPGTEISHQSVLLLHGAKFKSLTWVTLKTINQLAAMGHRVVAVDLPGYGETKATVADKGNYLKEFIERLNLRNLVIVSPSMSGGFSIPYIIKYSKDLDGYVPVAPVSTNEIVHDAPNILTPTLVIYGELDTGLGFTSRNHLSLLPNSQAVELPDAKHPAYLDQPDMFHKLLYNFLIQIRKNKNH